jgi:hypothetical protein
MDNGKILDDLLVECSSALFSAYDAALTYTGTVSFEAPPFVLSGVIGFAGNDMRGTLLLAMTGGLLEGLSPSAHSLLGRFKNQLLRFGTVIYAATPSVLRGELLAPVLPPGALAGHRFESAQGHACVWLDIVIRDGFSLPAPVADDVAPAEGGSLFFD